MIVDNTLLSDFAACTTKGVVRHGLGLTGKSEKVAADAGIAAHEALAMKLQGHSVEKALGAFRAAWGAYCKENPVEERLQVENLAVIMEEHLNGYWGTPQWPFEVLAESVEQGVRVPLDDAGEYEFFALCDAVVKERATGRYAPLDHKTTGRLNEWFSGVFGWGSQMEGYMWAVGRATGSPVNTAYINGVEFAKLPYPGKTKCRTHGCATSECWRQHVKWQPYVTSRGSGQLEEWRRDAIAIAKRARERLGKLGSLELVRLFALREGKFNGGCRWCEFGEWCKEGRTAEGAGRLLVEAPWKPWDGRRGR